MFYLKFELNISERLGNYLRHPSVILGNQRLAQTSHQLVYWMEEKNVSLLLLLISNAFFICEKTKQHNTITNIFIMKLENYENRKLSHLCVSTNCRFSLPICHRLQSG